MRTLSINNMLYLQFAFWTDRAIVFDQNRNCDQLSVLLSVSLPTAVFDLNRFVFYLNLSAVYKIYLEKTHLM